MSEETASAPAPSAGTMTPEACAAELKSRFPALFTGQPKPLKLHIQADIQQRAPGVFTKNVLSAFFRRYTGSHSYLLAMTKATQRFDLDGQPAGELAEEHRKAAADELARRRDNQNARRALEDQQRRNRAQLLWDFEHTTLTTPNFCALSNVKPEELDHLLEIAREERKQAPPPPAFDRPRHDAGRGGPGARRDRPQVDRPQGDRRPGGGGPSGPRGPQGDRASRGPQGARPGPGGRPQGGDRGASAAQPGQPGNRGPQGPKGPRPPKGERPAPAGAVAGAPGVAVAPASSGSEPVAAPPSAPTEGSGSAEA
jgi:hypothetical protein